MKRFRKKLHTTRSRRAVVLIAVMWLMVALAAMAIILTQRSRVGVAVGANETAQSEADFIELGAEQYVMAETDMTQGDSVLITQVPGLGQKIGNGYFWLLRPNLDDPTQYDFGITDEASKFNLNFPLRAAATAATGGGGGAATTTNLSTMSTTDLTNTIANLPGMINADPTVPASIVAWRGTGALAKPGAVPPGGGTNDTYYLSLPDSYHNKGSGFETVEELRLIQYVTPDVLYGRDLNHNGVLDVSEGAAPAQFGGGSNTDTGIGFAPYLTVYSVDTNAAIASTGSTSSSSSTTTGGIGAAGTSTTTAATTKININNATSANRISTLFSQNGLTTYTQKVTAAINTATGGRFPRPFANIFDFYYRACQPAGMSTSDFAKIINQIAADSATTHIGLINVWTASANVLACLPGMTISDAQSLIATRPQPQPNSGSNGIDPSDMDYSWVMTVLNQNQLVGTTTSTGMGGLITGRSFIYSADIVALSSDGRAFKRVKIVVDTRSSPPIVIFRKDLTSLGWPLDPAIRASVRAGEGVPDNMSIH